MTFNTHAHAVGTFCSCTKDSPASLCFGRCKPTTQSNSGTDCVYIDDLAPHVLMLCFLPPPPDRTVSGWTSISWRVRLERWVCSFLPFNSNFKRFVVTLLQMCKWICVCVHQLCREIRRGGNYVLYMIYTLVNKEFDQEIIKVVWKNSSGTFGP